MNNAIQIGLLGMGTVGGGVLKLLQKNGTSIEQRVGSPISVKKILVRDLNKPRQLPTDAILTTAVEDILDDPDISVVVEVMGGEQPALEYMLKAM
jgi:homoserine dehydrogenase